MSPLKSVAAALLFVAVQAHAISFTVSDGAFSTVEGVVTDTFDSDATISLNVSGGALFPVSGVTGVSARPAGSDGQWWSIGSSAIHATSGVVQLYNPSTYYGFLWGSPDGYNSVSFLFNGSVVGSFTGTDLFPTADGNQGALLGGQFVNFWAGEGEQFDEVRFVSGYDAFETDNHAVFPPPRFEIEVQAPVPEPETYALMLAGLCAIVFMARNRRRD